MKFLKKHNYQSNRGFFCYRKFEFNNENFFYANFKIGDEILNFKNQNYVLKLM